MGSFSEVRFAGYPAFEYKNSYNKKLVNLIFQPDDFIEELRSNYENIHIDDPELKKMDNPYYTYQGFKQSAKVCRKRLEIYGVSIAKAKANFINAIRHAKEDGDYSHLSFKGLTFKKYIEILKKSISSGKKDYKGFHFDSIEELVANNLGFYQQKLVYQLYSILSVLNDEDVIEYDLTYVLNSGWVEEEDVIKDVQYEKIIVLTEGKTDIEFISHSIEKLYPYLSPYYHFINFEEYKMESNASALVKTITSFAAANIKHPIIALFDNDTIGRMEMDTLLSKKLPDNIQVIKLPNIPLAKKYPTIGPTGKKNMNVNGTACGIEMYLGAEALTKEGLFIPIRWKAYNEKLGQYQGEVANKKYVQKKFREIIKRQDFKCQPEMNLLLKELFDSFQ